MRFRRQNGALGLLVIPMLLSWGCATSSSPYRYKVTLPILEVEPKVSPCHLKDEAGAVVSSRPCVTLLESDYHSLIVELKAACLGVGGSPKECRTEE